jgi:hypothetical protein
MLYSGLFLFRVGSGADCPFGALGLGALNDIPGGNDVRVGGGGLRCCGAGLCVIFRRFADNEGVGRDSGLLLIDAEACLDTTMLRGASFSAILTILAGACLTVVFLCSRRCCGMWLAFGRSRP